MLSSANFSTAVKMARQGNGFSFNPVSFYPFMQRMIGTL
jgi:hypothetical protein